MQFQYLSQYGAMGRMGQLTTIRCVPSIAEIISLHWSEVGTATGIVTSKAVVASTCIVATIIPA